MKTYCKIKTDKTIQMMPNIYKASWDLRNDVEGQIFCAKRDGWLVKKEKTCPEYNPETQYVECFYENTDEIDEETGLPYAIQVWTVHDLPV